MFIKDPAMRKFLGELERERNSAKKKGENLMAKVYDWIISTIRNDEFYRDKPLWYMQSMIKCRMDFAEVGNSERYFLKMALDISRKYAPYEES